MPLQEADVAASVEHWETVVRRLGGRGDVDGVGEALLAAYGEPHRRYHDRAHLAQVLQHAATLAPYAPQPGVVAVAGWFHDAVYDPGRADNEERSAAWAERALAALAVPPGTVAEVSRLVRLTATHDPAAEDGRGAVLCDADLAVLAADADRYAAYADGVRAEYAHVGEAAFRAGRAQILRELLARPTIYRTPYGARRWEAPARRNLAAELRDLAH